VTSRPVGRFQVLTAVIMKQTDFWDVMCLRLHHTASQMAVTFSGYAVKKTQENGWRTGRNKARMKKQK
jgi:hypothetical protein